MAKVPSMWQIDFVFPIQFVLILPFNRQVLHGNLRFFIHSSLNQKAVLQFFKKNFSFSEIFFQNQGIERVQGPSDHRMGHAGLLDGGLFWGSLVPLFWGARGLSIAFGIRPLRGGVFLCCGKIHLTFSNIY